LIAAVAAVHLGPTRSEPAAALSLKLTAAAAAIRVGETPDISAEIRNAGGEPALLVAPGDGSERGLRSPLAKWVIEPVPGEGRADGVLRTAMPCGNINALRPDQVFELKPGETRRFSGWDGSTFVKPGKYVVRYEYENRPNMEWAGIVLGEHDGGAMARVRQSLACKLTSGELILTVGE
jgi:hypothetical protein